MVLGFNLTGFISLILPPLLYAWIIYVSSPYKSLSIKNSSKFILGGIFSVVILSFIMYLFPFWSPYYFQDPFWQNFWVVAPREEISKFIMFLIIYGGLNLKEEPHPITYMFYFGMIGLGFALVENLQYVASYGFWVLKMRTFGAVFVHMICGLLFGYWVGMGKIKKSKFSLRTTSSIFLSSRPKLKSILYTLMGLITASIFHGLWNYHLSILGKVYSTPFSILLLIVGFLSCKLLSRDLINQYQKSNKHESLESRIDKDLDKI
jgi:RsiW-degrading membrane proteinase PrsW (M82 family)